MDLILDVNELTLGEVEELEDITGMTIEEFKPGMQFTSKLAIAFVYLSEKRSNPDYTLDDARKVKLAEFEPSSRPTEEAASTTP